MRKSPSIPALALATALLFSPLAAAWSSFGSYEPDTTYDTAGYMWPDAGPASADRIYFNAWSSVQTFVNANVGALQTSNEAFTMERHSAILGVWVDCNKDGYVGHAESALYEYSAALLTDTSVCPAAFGDAENWTEGEHNYNGWVSELIPIGRPFEDSDPTDDEEERPEDTRVYRDPAAKIWADYGLPGEAPRGTCALNPFPRGTMQSTGGLFNYLDCRYEVIEIMNAAIVATGDPLGLAFPDPEDAEGAPLDVGTFGNDGSEDAAVALTDCSADPFIDTSGSVNASAAGPTVNAQQQALENETGEDLPEGWEVYGFKLWPASPRVVDGSSPTLPGQTNQTREEIGGDCDTSNDAGHDFYSLLNEDDWTGSGGDTGKVGAIWSFSYHEGYRGNDVGEFLFGIGTGSTPGDGTAGVATGAGVGACLNLCATGWYGIGNLIKNGPNTVVVREDAGSPIAIAPGYYLSFYASLSAVTTQRFDTPGGVGTYGSEACGDNDEGIHGGWNCDRATWNLNPDGTPKPGQELLAAVGDPYALRDIDCYDGNANVADVPVGLGLPAYGDEPCRRP